LSHATNALYKAKKIGAIGVSGDSSCADHNIAWRVRKTLGLDKEPAGLSPNKDDGIMGPYAPMEVRTSGIT
jgi:hypothetical protein